MVDHVFAAEDRVVGGRQPELRDAQMLKKALHASISTSPEAFLTTIDDLNDKEVDYWEREIRFSTWTVIQRGDEIVGLAVGRWPVAELDRDVDPATARFIESVWITPELRGRRLAEQLVRFLFQVECAQSPRISRFLLWVFDKNYEAIRLYERMGFRYLARQDLTDRSGRAELLYEYRLVTDVRKAQAALAAQEDDPRRYGLVYRVLGKQ